MEIWVGLGIILYIITTVLMWFRWYNDIYKSYVTYLMVFPAMVLGPFMLIVSVMEYFDYDP